MTFEEAREKQLKKLDEEYQTLRSIVGLPDMCNPLFRDYVKAKEALNLQLEVVVRLNNACVEANQ